MGNTYLALGDSLAYGYHAAQFKSQLESKGYVEPSTFDNGYVNDFAAALKLAHPKLQVINDGCPGETSETFIDGSGLPGYCAGGPTGSPFPYAFLHHSYAPYTSQLADALAILKENPNVSPITLDIGANDVLQFLASKWLPRPRSCARQLKSKLSSRTSRAMHTRSSRSCERRRRTRRSC